MSTTVQSQTYHHSLQFLLPNDHALWVCLATWGNALSLAQVGFCNHINKDFNRCPYKPSIYFNVIFFVLPRELVWYLPQTAGMQVSVRQSEFFLRWSHTATQLGNLLYPSIPPRVSGTSLWEVGDWAAQQSTRAWRSLPRGLWLSLFSAGSWSETNSDSVNNHLWNNLI